MRKTFKYRIYPTGKQTRLLESQLEECRWLYNHWLAQKRDSYEATGKSPGLYDQQKELSALKVDRPALAQVHSQVLQNVAVRLDLALQAFFRRVKAGEKPGYPRFKGYGRYDSITFPQAPVGCSIGKDGKLLVSKVGHIKLVQHRPLPQDCILKTATLTRSSTGKWYVCFVVETDPVRLPKLDNSLGIDVGIKTFATFSHGQAIENPRFFRKEEKELAKAGRKLSKTTPPDKGQPASKERRKARKVVARVHERIRFKRTNFSHQHSRQVVNAFGYIFVEDLNVNRMVHNHCLAKSISDAAWTNFFTMIAAKAGEAGRKFVKVNPAYTSQDCSRCGHRQKMPLAERVFDCPDCELNIDRDLNASRNILRIGLDSLRNQSVDAPAFTPGE